MLNPQEKQAADAARAAVLAYVAQNGPQVVTIMKRYETSAVDTLISTFTSKIPSHGILEAPLVDLLKVGLESSAPAIIEGLGGLDALVVPAAERLVNAFFDELEAVL